MGRPKGSKNSATDDGDTISQAIGEVRPQVVALSGFSDADSLGEVIPETTVSESGATPEKKTRKKRTPRVVETASDPDDPMNDPEYKRAVQRLTGMGGQKLTAMPFDVWAMMARDPKLALDDDERKDWAAMWYIISKKANMVPDSWLGIGITASMLVTTQVGQRFAMTADAPALLKKYFGIEVSKEQFDEARELINS